MVKVIDLAFLGQAQTIASFLVETSEGPVLIETGPHSTLKNLENGLKKSGYRPEDVRHVFVTHIHFDHAGAAWAFAAHGAKIYVHPAGAYHLAEPAKLYESAKRIYGDQMEPLWGKMKSIPEDQIVPVGHKKKVKIGEHKFKAWHTPGHAVHHIAWQLGNEIFTGDVAGIKIGNGIVVPPCPPPDIDVEDWKSSIRMLLEQRFDALYLTHFGKVEAVKPHLVELRARLINWANWIKPLLDMGLPEAELTEKFKAYVMAQYEAGGVKGKALEIYENANPAFMSVAGLSRYWKKKA